MKIVVNDIAASSGGAITILKSFYNYLIQSGESKCHEWIFLLGSNYIKETDNIKVIILNNVKKSWVKRLKFDFYNGKSFISKLEPDVVFSLQNTITIGLKSPQALYMHQSIPFQKVKNFSFFKSSERKLAVYQHLIGAFIKLSIKKADKTIVQTKWIRDAVINSTKIAPEKVVTVFPPKDDYSRYEFNNLFRRNDFFYPADNSIYKNHKCLYEACNILSKRKMNENFNVSLTIDEPEERREGISYLGRIPFQRVLEKYNSSTLIFPSYIETVGLPLIEASYMGTIILAADCPYSREVLEGYKNAYFFNPFKPKELADLMEKVIQGKIKKEKEMVYGNKREVTDSWKKITDCILELGQDKSL